MRNALTVLLFLLGAGSGDCSAAGLPAVPVPPENRISEEKRILGKILFWDEQLSSDSSVACGSCHRPANGGSDPRAGVHPGQGPGTIDDVIGSPGIVHLDSSGSPQEHPIFGRSNQVTPRASPANFGGLWANEVFWDGRAGPTFTDPITGDVAIANGGALENQVIATLLNDTEMAKTGRTWAGVADRIRSVQPLALASDWPDDIRQVLADDKSYADLFQDAFGDSRMTPTQIAFAIATYQRTLIADQTPWDRFQSGDEAAMSLNERAGWRDFQDFNCSACHVPPLFTNNDFLNIGLRRAEFDIGRQHVTGLMEDAGEVKVPSLRNVGLRPRLMHSGEFASLDAAIRFYVNTIPFPERDHIPGVGTYSFSLSAINERNIRLFLANALTDTRVREEIYPFDRPTLKSENESP